MKTSTHFWIHISSCVSCSGYNVQKLHLRAIHKKNCTIKLSILANPVMYIPYMILYVAHVILQVEWEKPAVKPGGRASHDPVVAMILLL